MLFADYQIRELVEQCGLIDPFVPELVREVDGRRVVSYGPGPCGYDMRLASTFKIVPASIASRSDGYSRLTIDPKAFDFALLEDVETNILQLPPFGVALGRSVETFRLPNDVIGRFHVKSTYQRAFIHVPSAVMQPGWSGQLVIEITNLSPYSARIYANEGICEVQFERVNRPDCAYSGNY